MSANESLFLTTAAAVAVAMGIESVSSCKADIKWVNDVYINEKKVCGILTEGALNIETGGLDYTIVGIGINIYSPRDGFPESIENIAGSVFSNRNFSSGTRNFLTATILNNFMDYYFRFPDRSFFEEYKARSFLLGRKIYVVEGKELTPATALDLTDDCHLVVRLEDGKIKELSSGEVSTRINNS